jgi:hypothetical protein
MVPGSFTLIVVVVCARPKLIPALRVVDFLRKLKKADGFQKTTAFFRISKKNSIAGV